MSSPYVYDIGITPELATQLNPYAYDSASP